MDYFATAISSHSRQLLVPSVLPTPLLNPLPQIVRFPLPQTANCRTSLVNASSAGSNCHPIAHSIKRIATGAIILSASLLSCRLSRALAEAPPFPATADSSVADPDSEIQVEHKTSTKAYDGDTLSTLLESNSEAVSALRSLLYQKLEEGEDLEALSIIRRLMAAQPAELEWKFLAARLLNEMGQAAESRKLLEEVLAADPFSFEALFENAVLMDRCGEGDAVIGRLERVLELARAEQKEAVARDVRLIMAQIQFLQRNVEAALSTYEELAREEPKDYRPYFCQGVIYTLLDRNKEAREKFAKYNALSQNKAEVNAYLQTPLSRVKLYGTGDSGR